ncbi:hypothetical protein BDC45DRAFT_515982 [Circinella umbellata]|nr:hypothetical protein BDC45DRAFT_515982 [Circinella umbellata]
MLYSRQIIQKCTQRFISSSNKKSTIKLSIGKKSDQYLAYYDTLIHNVQKRRLENGHQRNLSLTEKILYGHGLDKQSYLKANNHLPAFAFAASSSSPSCSCNTNQNNQFVHEKPISCDDNILLENFTFFPGGLLFKTKNKSDLLSSRVLFQDVSGTEAQIDLDHQYHSAVTKHNNNAGVLSTLCVGRQEDSLDDVTTPLQATDNIIGTFLSTEEKEATNESFLPPKIIGVRLQGHLSGWTTPKDVYLHISELIKKHQVGNKKNQSIILEFHGPGTDNVSYDDRIEICSMITELGNNISALFPFTDQTFNYLCTTGQRSLAYAASAIADVYLQPDQGAIYDDLIKVQLNNIQPYIHGPFTANRLTRLNKLKDTALDEEWPDELSAISISITDKTTLSRVVRIAKQARQRGLQVKIPFRIFINDRIISNNGDSALLVYLFESVGAQIVSQPSKMIGHGVSKDMDDFKWISVLATSCANVFDEELRYMGNPNSHAFVASPEIVMAMAFAGKLSFNPVHDRIVGRDGIPFQFTPSTKPLLL